MSISPLPPTTIATPRRVSRRILTALAVTILSPALAPPTARTAPTIAEDIPVAAFDFDTPAGAPDPQGWRALGVHEDEEAYFHVEDFGGAGHDAAPLAGEQSMWCGLTREDPRTCGWNGAPGYGNSWLQNLTSRTFVVQGDVTLEFLMQTNVETSYERTQVQYEDPTGSWVTLDSYDCGFTSCDPTPRSYVIPADDHDGELRIRFFFGSDGAISDEDGLYPSHVAFVLDDLRVLDATGLLSAQDFEGEAVGDSVTLDGDWFAEPNTDADVAGGLVDGTEILQESSARNDSHFWAFLEGSTTTYACAGHPEQATTPDVLRNVVRSPRIDVTLDVDGRPIEGALDALTLEFDVYRDLGISKQYYWQIRFYADDCFASTISQYYGEGEKDWYRHSIPMTPPAGTTAIEIDLAIATFDYQGSYCTTHAPLFDDVRVLRSGGTVTAVDDGPIMPVIHLDQNRPNPFNPTTTISYEIAPVAGHVTLRIFDVSGRLVRTLADGPAAEGRQRVTWDGRDASGRAVSSGVYFYELGAGDQMQRRRMVLLR